MKAGVFTSRTGIFRFISFHSNSKLLAVAVPLVILLGALVNDSTIMKNIFVSFNTFIACYGLNGEKYGVKMVFNTIQRTIQHTHTHTCARACRITTQQTNAYG